jgi:hypothetical protein
MYTKCLKISIDIQMMYYIQKKTTILTETEKKTLQHKILVGQSNVEPHVVKQKKQQR